MIPVTFDTVATLQFGSEGHPTSLHFAIPEEWKTCKIRLHLRRSDGSFVPPMQLDENGCVKVDRTSLVNDLHCVTSMGVTYLPIRE